MREASVSLVVLSGVVAVWCRQPSAGKIRANSISHCFLTISTDLPRVDVKISDTLRRRDWATVGARSLQPKRLAQLSFLN
jgi:hypothetical protein